MSATDDDRVAEDVQLVDKAESDRLRGQIGTPIETSRSVAATTAASSSASDERASRALPCTLSSVRLKTTLGSAHQAS